MFGMSVLVLAGGALMLGAFRTHDAAVDGLARLRLRNTLADQFRADVAQAAACPTAPANSARVLIA